MTRLLLAAATLAGALSLATPAAAASCDLPCRLECQFDRVVECLVPVPVPRCIYTTDFVICI